MAPLREWCPVHPSATGVPDDDGDVLQIVYSQLAVTNPPPTGPTILTQPTNETVSVGQTAVFTVVAEGTAPLKYQWLFDGIHILAGATNSSLSLSNANPMRQAYMMCGCPMPSAAQQCRMTLTVNQLAVPGYICAVLRSDCTDAPPPPLQVGAVASGPDYVIITAGYGDPGIGEMPDRWQPTRSLNRLCRCIAGCPRWAASRIRCNGILWPMKPTGVRALRLRRQAGTG